MEPALRRFLYYSPSAAQLTVPNCIFIIAAGAIAEAGPYTLMKTAQKRAATMLGNYNRHYAIILWPDDKPRSFDITGD